MEGYILDDFHRRIQVVDTFDSLIWTERYAAKGDFELVMHSTLENRNRFPTGTRLASSESYRIGVVRSVEDSTDDEGRALLKIKGPTFEHILEDRVARGALSDLTTEPKWILTGTPGAIVRKIFHDICIVGTLDVEDIIPLVVEDNIFPEDTLPEPTETITVEIEPSSVYDAIKTICDQYELGFRLVRNFDSGILYWDVYAGSDRTTQQHILPAVVFSPELENLSNTSEFTTDEEVKNVAYVFSPVGYAIVYPQDVDPETVIGLNRRILLVKADDIVDVVPEDALEKMIRRGRQELAKHRRYSAFDGEVDQNSTYKYGRDYNLGDLIEVRIVTGVTSYMRVTEQIFVSDKEGDRSYPTLSVNKFITPGVWSAWNYNQVWEDLGEFEYWADQP